MLLDIEVMVESEEEAPTDEKFDDLDIELEGEEVKERGGKKKEFTSIPVNTQQITMIQEMESGHSLVFINNEFPPITARLSKDKLKAKINKNIKEYYG